MRFNYYDRLSLRNQVSYRKSDRLTDVALPVDAKLRDAVAAVRAALAEEKLPAVQQAMARFSRLVCAALDVAPLVVRVKARRPIRRDGEYHGLYEREDGSAAILTLWMHTARQKRVVTFKTFLRTFVHELCHHLDYDLFGLDESFHTEGFFKRESSLYRKLVPGDEPTRRGRERTAVGAEAVRSGRAAKAVPEQGPRAGPRSPSKVESKQIELPLPE